MLTGPVSPCRGAPERRHVDSGALLDNAPPAHHQDVLADVPHHGQVVADEDEPDVGLSPDVVEEVQHLCLHRDVEGRHRLVEDQHTRLDGERTSDRDALALTAREATWQRLALPWSEAHLVQQLRHPPGSCTPVEVGVQAQHTVDAVPHPDPRVQGQIGVLEDDLDRAGACLAGLSAPSPRLQDLAADEDGPGVGDLESDQHPRGGGLAGPGLTHEPDGAPGAERERQSVDGLDVGVAHPVGLAQARDLEQCRCRHRALPSLVPSVASCGPSSADLRHRTACPPLPSPPPSPSTNGGTSASHTPSSA